MHLIWQVSGACGCKQMQIKCAQAPKGGGRGIGHDPARTGSLLGAVKATNDAGLRPSSQLVLGAGREAYTNNLLII